MKSKENLVFLGMMGSGKSSIGSLIAKKLKLDFIDIDKEIEKELGSSIKKIFETKGEEYFRKFEEKITLKKLKLSSSIISLGGGAFINKNIRKEVLKNHLSFWLKLNSDILIGRIKNSIKRPLALNASNIDLKNMIKDRSKYYAKASFKIDCDHLSKKEITNKILDIYETN